MNEPIISNRRQLLKICKDNDIIFMAIFGSIARGDFTEKSDVDLLVRFAMPKSLIEIVRIERTFSETLGRKTDLLTEASVSPYLRSRIEKEMEVFYERP